MGRRKNCVGLWLRHAVISGLRQQLLGSEVLCGWGPRPCDMHREWSAAPSMLPCAPGGSLRNLFWPWDAEGGSSSKCFPKARGLLLLFWSECRVWLKAKLWEAKSLLAAKHFDPQLG